MEKKIKRIHAKNILLNYRSLKLSPENVLKQLTDKLDINIYLIGKEEDSTIKVYLYFDKKKNITCYENFDLIQDSNTVVHANYEPVFNPDFTIKTIRGSKYFITNMTNEVPFNEKLLQIAKNSGLTAAMKFFAEEKPELVSYKYKSTKANLEEYIKDQSLNLA